MEIKSVITRKPVSDLSRLNGLFILATLDAKRIQAMEKPEDDMVFALQTLEKLDKAAKYLGFSNYNDLIEFIKMFGPESL